MYYTGQTGKRFCGTGSGGREGNHLPVWASLVYLQPTPPTINASWELVCAMARSVISTSIAKRVSWEENKTENSLFLPRRPLLSRSPNPALWPDACCHGHLGSSIFACRCVTPPSDMESPRMAMRLQQVPIPPHAVSQRMELGTAPRELRCTLAQSILCPCLVMPHLSPARRSTGPLGCIPRKRASCEPLPVIRSRESCEQGGHLFPGQANTSVRRQP